MGKVAEHNVCAALWISIIGGNKILFVEPTSNVVDHKLIENWLAEWLPRSAYTERAPIRLNMTNPTNFYNIFPDSNRPVLTRKKSRDKQVEAV